MVKQRERQAYAIWPWGGKRRVRGVHPGGEADKGDQHVVGQERCGGNQAGLGAEVLPGHHVGAAAVRVGWVRLAGGEVEAAEKGRDC